MASSCAETPASPRAGHGSASGAGPGSASGAGPGSASGAGPGLSAAQRARIERQRLRARALHDARLAPRPPAAGAAGGAGAGGAGAGARDTGGGFLLEEPAQDARRAPAQAPAPVVDRREQPHCLECARPFPMSYLFDTFDYSVCDECRDEEAHALLTRTEAKALFLLQDCDLDARAPALRCVRRRNPHKAHYSDMRLYLRAQVEERALQVWGSEAALEEERAARAQRRQRAQETGAARRLRALRLAARSSLLARGRPAPHAHAWGPERHDPAADLYSRTCATCHHTETYEKM